MHVRLRNSPHRHPGIMDQITGDMPLIRQHLILRPQEISNNPEIIRRLGIISINTAPELDLFGNVNWTHTSWGRS